MTTDSDDDFIKEIQKDFLDEASFLLEQCEESYLKLDLSEHREEELGKIFRLAHSMKGAGAAVGFLDLAAFAHVVEDCLSLLRKNPDLVSTPIISILLRSGDAFKNRIEMLKRNDPAEWDISALKNEVDALVVQLSANGEKEARPPLPSEAPVSSSESAKPPSEEMIWEDMARQTQSQLETASTKSSESGAQALKSGGVIKIDADRIESVLNIVGELVVIKSQLINQAGSHFGDLRLASIVSLMDKNIRELQERTLGMRMTPLKSLFLKTQRVIRDLALKLEKPVDFHMTGEETEIDRTMVDLLSDPLMHIARNSLDHGIERPEVRKTHQKPEKGTIHLSAQLAGGRILIRVKDDGAGINRDRVLKKAIENGLLPPGQDPATLSDKQVFGFLFMPGFSTAEKVTDVSGRGVGMDVVKSNIERIKGSIDVESTPGAGTVLTIAIPLTTSIADGMIVQSGSRPYIVPTDCIRELVHLNVKSLVRIQDKQEVLHHRDRVYELVRLSDRLPSRDGSRQDGDLSEDATIVLVEVGTRVVALQTEKVLGQAQVVLKPLGPSFPSHQGIAGAAVLGDGTVALVLDPSTLVENRNSA